MPFSLFCKGDNDDGDIGICSTATTVMPFCNKSFNTKVEYPAAGNDSPRDNISIKWLLCSPLSTLSSLLCTGSSLSIGGDVDTVVSTPILYGIVSSIYADLIS